AKVKQAADIHSSSLDQQTLDQLLRHFPLDEHIGVIAENYGARMRQMQELLAARMPQGLSWIEPKGGMFLWLELPEGLDAEALLKAAVQKGVAFVPGSAFYAGEPKRNTARLNFTYTTGEQMAVG